MKFAKTYNDSTVTIWECKETQMRIEYLKHEKFYIVIDSDNCFVWEFETLKEAKQGAFDWFNSEDIF